MKLVSDDEGSASNSTKIPATEPIFSAALQDHSGKPALAQSVVAPKDLPNLPTGNDAFERAQGVSYRPALSNYFCL